MISDGETVVRLLVAVGLGALVGLEREWRDQAAGLRTHMLVALGSCLFTLVSAYGFEEFASASSDTATRADVTRIASQVVVGIGFIGGGAILRHGGNVRGLTTAGSLWVTAAVGVSVGAGFTLGAAVAAVIALVALTALKQLERRLIRARREDDGPALPPD